MAGGYVTLFCRLEGPLGSHPRVHPDALAFAVKPGKAELGTRIAIFGQRFERVETPDVGRGRIVLRLDDPEDRRDGRERGQNEGEGVFHRRRRLSRAG